MSLARRLRVAGETAVARLRMPLAGRFDDYKSASAACGPKTYEDADLVDVVRSKTRHLVDRMRAAGGRPEMSEAEVFVAWATLMAADRGAVRVLDFGGACGTHYHICSAALRDRTQLRWNVVETPAMATAAQEFASATLRFTSDLTDVPDFRSSAPDLLLCSSSLQYVPQPLETFARLLALQPRYVCIVRTPLAAKGPVTFSVQRSRLSNNGPGHAPIDIPDRGVRYPIAILSEERLFDTAAAYAPLADHAERGTLYHPDHGLIPFRSLLLKRR